MRTLIMTVVAAGLIAPSQQNAAHEELARRLANVLTRRDAVAQVVASPRFYIPILLAWTRNPPPGVLQYELNLGMAQAFSELRTKDAIPFLIKNIGIQLSSTRSDSWMISPPAIEQNMPAVGALIRIGSDSLPAVIAAYSQPMKPMDRLGVVFVLGRIRDPLAAKILIQAKGIAGTELYWADEGLKQQGVQGGSGLLP